MSIDPESLARVEQGHVAVLADLDRRGLLVGAGETCADYATRLRCLAGNLESMDSELERTGRFEIEGMRVTAAARIPAS